MELPIINKDVRRYIVQLARYTYYKLCVEENTDFPSERVTDVLARFCFEDYRSEDFYYHALKDILVFGMLPKMHEDEYFRKPGLTEMTLTAYDLYGLYGTDYKKSYMWLTAQIEELQIERALK